MWDLASLTKITSMIAIMGTYSETHFYNIAEKQAMEISKYIKPDDIVLDVGCGIGEFEKYLHEKCRDLYAVDITEGFLRIARKEYHGVENLHFLKINGKDLKIFPNSYFNFIFCIGVFERIPKSIVIGYIKEFKRILNVNGRAYLQFVGPKGVREKYIKNILDKNNVYDGLYVIFSINELKNIFSINNLKILDLYEEKERIYALIEKA